MKPTPRKPSQETIFSSLISSAWCGAGWPPTLLAPLPGKFFQKNLTNRNYRRILLMITGGKI